MTITYTKLNTIALGSRKGPRKFEKLIFFCPQARRNRRLFYKYNFHNVFRKHCHSDGAVSFLDCFPIGQFIK